MDSALEELLLVMPPLEDTRGTNIDWKQLEERVRLPYPTHFKEFVAAYGNAVWCGSWHLFYNSRGELEQFMETMEEVVSSEKEKELYKWGGARLPMPAMYPEKGGLLPFLIDFDNHCLYSWRTKHINPDHWPVVCHVNDQVAELRGITIAGMFLEWLHRTDRMRRIWGDVRDVEEEELRLHPR